MLSHPLLQEAAETLFVPIAIKNNTKGDADAKVLAHFGEPAWNNPVVQFLTHDEKPLAPKLHDDWSVAALATGMVQASAEVDRHMVPFQGVVRRFQGSATHHPLEAQETVLILEVQRYPDDGFQGAGVFQ